MRVSDTRVTPAKPVEGLEKTLSIEIWSGGLAPLTGTTRGVFGQPGLSRPSTRAEVFSFVSEGVAGTRMPAWKEHLSETERWQVIRYLTDLAGGRVSP